MTRNQFLYEIKTFGDPSLSDEDKWKSIIFISLDDMKGITYFQDLIKQNRVAYVNKLVTAPDSTQLQLTGFMMLDAINPELDFKGRLGLLYVGCERIISLTFRNFNDNTDHIYSDIDSLMTAASLK